MKCLHDRGASGYECGVVERASLLNTVPQTGKELSSKRRRVSLCGCCEAAALQACSICRMIKGR